jgi:hypothetical protein
MACREFAEVTTKWTAISLCVTDRWDKVCVTEGHCACLQHRAVSLSAETDGPQHNSNQGPSEEERRANRNVERRQTVSAEPSAVGNPQQDGLGTASKSGKPQQ